jgi:hypothetical protein
MKAGSTQGSGVRELAFETFGVRVGLAVRPPRLFDRVLAVLPPGSRPCPSTRLDATFGLCRDAAGTYELRRDGAPLAGNLELELALNVLEREVQALVALGAPDHVFVHAGAVAHRGAAIVIPGASLAGKTTLVAALVRAGAEYYSDECAPLDNDGLVHPYARPLSLRNELYVQVDHDVDLFGGTAGEEPVRVGAVIVTRYEEGAEWRPRRLTAGEATLALLSHTMVARSRPAQALRAIGRSIESASAVESPRGNADAVAPLLLAELERLVT